ncbi:MAG: hypothetical protein E4H08_09865, partial [Candidatus Atribacteria bacterium]
MSSFGVWELVHDEFPNIQGWCARTHGEALPLRGFVGVSELVLGNVLDGEPESFLCPRTRSVREPELDRRLFGFIGVSEHQLGNIQGWCARTRTGSATVRVRWSFRAGARKRPGWRAKGPFVSAARFGVAKLDTNSGTREPEPGLM